MAEKTEPKPKRSPKAQPNARETTPDAESPARLPSLGFPVVGVGASAGGLEAFTQLLKALPADTGMAFVLIQHLAPTHPSALADILSRATSMPIMDVIDDLAAEPNHIYVIPPDRNLTISEGKLRLFQRAAGHQRPIDQFFSSLAEEQGHLAMGVVLSGTATDGTLGLEEIKAAGGITFAQDDTAQHDGMPRSAINSGCVDFVLPPAGIADEIAYLAKHPFIALHPEPGEAEVQSNKSELAPILGLLRAATNVDFSQYKVNTLYRRIKRRMILLKFKNLREYFRFLRDTPAEVEALYQDILISVTSFFRDPGMFESLKTSVIPKMLEGRSRNDPLRMWVLGCSTGEEAYSMAMTFMEASENTHGQFSAQIFASDLNSAGIEKARAGVYSDQRLHDVSPERLARFFVDVEGACRVSKPIREMCVFAEHNVMSDPPFSRIDLISCRNMLIYLEPEMQERILPILHYALKPDGCLVLGGSESVGKSRGLFDVVDGKHKIFVKKQGTGNGHAGLAVSRSDKGNTMVPADRSLRMDHNKVRSSLVAPDVHKEAERLLLARFAPPGVLVNAELDILQFRGDTSSYLTPAPGKASLSLLKMAQRGLVAPLRAAINGAKTENRPIRQEGVQFGSGQDVRNIVIEVIPVRSSPGVQGGYLVLFEESSSLYEAKTRPSQTKTVARGGEQESAEEHITRVEQELASTRDYLQSIIEQMEATNEELQSASEEVQSSNEELQSVNEELETSKEEIQSSNEELITVNDELQHRNEELGRANSDLTNLIGSVKTAIVMVDRDLSIRRFSPEAEKLLNIIPSDLGRPISHIRMNVSVPNLRSLFQQAIDTVGDREVEVQDSDGCWYSLRIRPYITLENKIDGAVMMLNDIDSIRRSRDYAESIVQTVREPLVILDSALKVRSANRSFHDTFNVTEQVEGKSFLEVSGGRWNVAELRDCLKEISTNGTAFSDLVLEQTDANGSKKSLLLNARRLEAPDADESLILLAIEDRSRQVMAERELADVERHSRVELEHRVDERTHELQLAHKEMEGFSYTVAHDLRAPLRAIIFNSKVLIEDLGGSLSDEHKDLLSRQASNATKLGILIDDLLQFSRITRVPLKAALVDVSELARDIVVEVSKTHSESSCKFEVQEEMQAQADEALLRMALVNLMENACKFSPKGGTINVGSSATEDGQVFFVKDEGIGLDMTFVDKIFQPFERLHSESEYPGTGIGLATVKRIIERHGGRVWVESEVGLGSAFYFTLEPPEPK